MQNKHFQLDSGLVNILSLPGGRIKNVYDFIPEEGQYDNIILFIGGNDCFQKSAEPSSRTHTQIAADLNDLGNILAPRAKEVFILGVPERHQQPERTKEVNKDLLKLSQKASWKFRSISKFLYAKHISGDDVHIDVEGLKNIKKLLKQRVLYNKYSIELDNKGNSEVLVCGTRSQPSCICGHFEGTN